MISSHDSVACLASAHVTLISYQHQLASAGFVTFSLRKVSLSYCNVKLPRIWPTGYSATVTAEMTPILIRSVLMYEILHITTPKRPAPRRDGCVAIRD